CGANLALVSEALSGAKSRRPRSASGRAETLLSLFRSVKLSNERRDVNGQTAMAFFGELKVDLTAAPLPEGETKISIYSIFGGTEIRVPEDVGVRITGLCMLGGVKVRRKQIASGIFDTQEYRSPNYEQATRRLHIDAVTVFAELKIKQ
ncbi:MAG TPA: cell wall-active antibiotics response protein LiaF, partial [Blastocatellia bacterium]|nr:cell wall-active antibiotics response protein LiaF [Blastocatellia bacterium]